MIIEATKLSLEIAVLSAFISLVLSFTFAIFIYRGKRKREKIIEGIISFPMFFSPSVLGYILLIIIGRNGIIGSWLNQYGIELIFTREAAIIACIIVSIPMAYQCIKVGLLEIDIVYFEAAHEMGANKLQLYRYIVLPLLKKTLESAAILAFGRSFGEFGATLMVAGNIPGKTQTVPMAIYYAVERGDTKSANVLLVIVLVISFTVMWVYNYYWINKKVKGIDKYER